MQRVLSRRHWPDVADETAKLQKKIAAAETRVQVAIKVFDKTRRPLEDIVRVQREELARRKVIVGLHVDREPYECATV